MKRIRFQGADYLLIGETVGAIATQHQYENGLCSYAHLFPDGLIRRFDEVIGTKADIEFLDGEPEVDVKPDAIGKVMRHHSWFAGLNKGES